MDQGLDKSKAPSTSYRETFRRHRKLLCLPILLGAVAAGFFQFGMAKTYKSTASLWVDTTPPAQSSIGAGSSALSEPPATAEQGILSELLATGSFASAVAEHSSLGKSLGSGNSTENALMSLGPSQLVPTVAGNQILQISYSASSPDMAKSVLAAVVAQLRNYTDHLTAQHDQAAVGYDRDQVKAAETALATARSNVTAYQAQHPGATQTDPNYVSLMAAENNAVTQLAQANTALSQVTGAGTAGWSIQVIDPPSPASTTAPGKKKAAELILGGALGGLLVSFLAVVALTPAKKEAWEDELPVGGPFGSDAAPADPFPPGSLRVPITPARSTAASSPVRQPRLSLGDRRFQSRTPSAPTEEQ